MTPPKKKTDDVFPVHITCGECVHVYFSEKAASPSVVHNIATNLRFWVREHDLECEAQKINNLNEKKEERS